ncbi:hypothetical protein [Sphingomonas sp.]|uniref:hypothetical protein n=1 Tax=Sphingomonas sp. TaxID=28214 RepID=UPI000DBC2C3A|nr:hypothetical protein [Sphingomonas sp.]PZT91979.1 MAG: hypothetical protein DI625_14695 [Sphingomonas sp.]
MIERTGVTVLGIGTAATAALPKPVVWHFLGYPFEAASMVAAIFAAIVTRVIINTRAKSTNRTLDLAVLALVLLTTGSIVAGWHLNLVGGLLLGTGLATIGEGILRIAEKYVNKALDVFDIGPPAPPAPIVLPVQTPPAGGEGAAIGDALDRLDKQD